MSKCQLDCNSDDGWIVNEVLLYRLFNFIQFMLCLIVYYENYCILIRVDILEYILIKFKLSEKNGYKVI